MEKSSSNNKDQAQDQEQDDGMNDEKSDLSNCQVTWNVHIVWSTESGRAKACARRAARILRESFPQVNIHRATSLEQSDTFRGLIGIQKTNQVVGADDTSPQIVESKQSSHHKTLFICFISTTGDGEQCEAIRQVWKSLLSRSLTHTRPFSSMQDKPPVSFALFGLGDRAYGDMYCAAARKFGARMVQLGAQSVCPVGYGDDATPNGGVFFDLDVWLLQSLLPTFTTRSSSVMAIPSEARSMTARLIPEQQSTIYRVKRQQPQPLDKSLLEYETFFHNLAPPTAYNFPFIRTATIVDNRRLTCAEWVQDTRHIVLHMENGNLQQDKDKLLYHAGDICTILPCNSRDTVDSILQVLPQAIRECADCPIQIESSESEAFQWPRHVTLRGWLTYCADIQALPEREDLRELSAYCSDPEQAEKLLSLSEPKSSALYADYILREKRSWCDVLYDFDSASLALEHLFQLFSPIRPRHFSIASESFLDKIELCVALVEGITPLGRTYRGLCSSYLVNAKLGESVRLWIKPGSFRLPLTMNISTAQYESPILCIGAGTGIAPLRSLLRERERRRAVMSTSTESVDCDALLIFGCRKESKDFYYSDEWESLKNSKRLQCYTAFSQDQWYKVYVQQRMAEQKDMIVNHIFNQGGSVFVAGGANMARSVKQELVEILSEVLGDAKKSQAMLKRLQNLGKYAVEAWS